MSSKHKQKKYALSAGCRSVIVDILKTFKEPICFEWGCGLSTFWFLDHCPNIKRWISIEDNADWYNRLNNASTSSKLTIKLIQPTDDRPKNDWYRLELQSPFELSSYFRNYIVSIREYQPDFVLIDGRARLQCLAATVDQVNLGGAVLLHDSHRIRRDPQLEKAWKPTILRWSYVKKLDKKLDLYSHKKFEW